LGLVCGWVVAAAAAAVVVVVVVVAVADKVTKKSSLALHEQTNRRQRSFTLHAAGGLSIYLSTVGLLPGMLPLLYPYKVSKGA
jgi:hypothetical protein